MTEVVPSFDTYVGIHYSGAETVESSLPGLRMYSASKRASPAEVQPPRSPRSYWTRSGVAEWLEDRLTGNDRMLIGIDHAFSFPVKFFYAHNLPLDWTAFLEDFRRHWPTHEKYTYVDFVRDGIRGNGAARQGNRRWRRLTDIQAGGAKSVFDFDKPRSFAKATHAGLPWLLHIRERAGAQVHFWPFDGWDVRPGQSAVVEVFPALWSRSFLTEGRAPHEHDAYSIARWMRDADCNGSLTGYFQPPLGPVERNRARIEGWILGIACREF